MEPKAPGSDPLWPTIVVGVGSFGARIARRLAEETASALRLPGEALDPVRLADEVRQVGLELVTAAALDGRTVRELPARVAERARVLLDHGRLVGHRDAPGRDGPTRLHVLVLGHLGEAEVRQALPELLPRIGKELLSRFEPLFRTHRRHDERALLVLPLLCMPHAAALPPPEREQLLGALRGLGERVTAAPPAERATPQLYLLEDVAELSVLGDAEQEACIRNFATFLIHSLDALPDRRGLLYGRHPDEPLATFVCAVAELPRRALARYAECRVALEVVGAILDAKRLPLDDARLDALEAVELARLDAPETATEDVRALLDRYVAPFEADPDPRWYVPGEALRETYGPDTGDAASDADQPPADPPVGWAEARMREVESAWRLLQRRRFDDLVGRERRAVEQVKEELLAAIRDQVDHRLFDPPRPEGFREADVVLEVLQRDVAERLEEAVRARDEVEPPPAPSFDRFRGAHAAFLDAARAKPDLARMVVFGLLFVACWAAFAPPLLRALPRVTTPPQWLLPWLTTRAPITATLLGLAVAAGILIPRYRRAHLRIRAAHRETWRALGDTVRGLRGSVLDYYASRLRLARRVARVEALLALGDAIARDRQRLALVDRALRHGRSRFLEELRRLGVHRHPEGGAVREDLSELLAGGPEGHPSALVEPLVGPTGAEAIRHALPPEQRATRIADVLRTLARDRHWRREWRHEVPFADQEALTAACRPHATPVSEWDPYGASGSAEEAADAIAAFIRRQARSLGVALRFARHLDPTDVTTVSGGEGVVPPEAYEAVRRRLDETPAAGRPRIPVHRGLERDRAYYVVALTDLHPAAVLPPIPESAEPAELRFEVER
ncbi:MAG: hypothetical protein CMN30_25790 [Sandaracinus sp.]|nr:hypothetical protein [Sandaracinus sp.]